MGPLVYYCRWHNAKLRLRGRDGLVVWGELIFLESGEEKAQRFRFDQRTRELWVIENGVERYLQLDEMGVVKTSAGDAPQ